ncbi:hypothetical protein SCP_0213470 [Sparassis crispa]|uniref:Helicase C-terminal domain-containing protein n=1 Tax=Sparassis crispa TaxID=139825 RepID=A0A401GD83_9APHY|nr:hypothetical protein SCP_0213470 [Sparassis crispa]GBE80144.1 hypothetical protein SCP_0213470 [Sparassis crispa]
MHSINCPECKREGFAALYEREDEQRSAIFVATAVLEVGVNIPGLRRVISYGGSKSASSWIQEGGRPAREPNTHGEAIFYVKKSDIDAAITYVQSEPVDERLLTARDSNAHIGEDDRTASDVEAGAAERRSEGDAFCTDDLAMPGPSENGNDDGEGLCLDYLGWTFVLEASG